MSFSIGLVGLPNVGKSTLFQALTSQKVANSNFPFCTIEPNLGTVTVPDQRLNELAKLSGSKKTLATTIEFVDIAGLVKNAHQGDGLGNQFLHHIRQVDAIAQVVRDFDSPKITHVDGQVNPQRDIDTINTELIMADLATVTKRLTKFKGDLAEKNFLTTLQTKLDQGIPIRDLPAPETTEDQIVLQELSLLTIKPILYVINSNQPASSSFQVKNELNLVLSAQEEAELSVLPATEAAELRAEFDLQETGLDKLITSSYKLLNLITFLTTGPQETRAWTLKNGSLAPQAGGAIHSDLERGFICMETINWQKLIQAGSWSEAKEKGLIRNEGKNYQVKDGDVVDIKFSV